MPNQDNKSKKNSTSKSDAQVPEIKPLYAHPEYGPEDFSQSAINRGQRRINYELTHACQKLSAALALLTEVVTKSAPGSEQALAEVQEVVVKATSISDHVASIKPPGCDPGAAPEEAPKNPPPPPTEQ